MFFQRVTHFGLFSSKTAGRQEERKVTLFQEELFSSPLKNPASSWGSPIALLALNYGMVYFCGSFFEEGKRWR